MIIESMVFSHDSAYLRSFEKACKSGDISALRALLALGLDPDVNVMAAHNVIAHAAIHSPDTRVLDLLLSSPMKGGLSKRYLMEETLSWACRSGNAAAVRTVLSQPDEDKRHLQNTLSDIFCDACANGSVEVVRQLLALQDGVLRVDPSDGCHSGFYTACMHRRWKVVEELLSLTGKHKVHSGATTAAFWGACEAGDVEVMCRLLGIRGEARVRPSVQGGMRRMSMAHLHMMATPQLPACVPAAVASTVVGAYPMPAANGEFLQRMCAELLLVTVPASGPGNDRGDECMLHRDMLACICGSVARTGVLPPVGASSVAGPLMLQQASAGADARLDQELYRGAVLTWLVWCACVGSGAVAQGLRRRFEGALLAVGRGTAGGHTLDSVGACMQRGVRVTRGMDVQAAWGAVLCVLGVAVRDMVWRGSDVGVPVRGGVAAMPVGGGVGVGVGRGRMVLRRAAYEAKRMSL